MRVYYEFRNSCNNRAIPLVLLDKIVAKFFGGVPDEKKFYMPEGDTLSWTYVIHGLLWTNDLVRWHNRVEMDELVRQLIENGSLYQPDDTKAYMDLLHYFQHLNLYLYVVFLDQGMIEPYDKNASYMTTDSSMIYTEEEVAEILKNVVGRGTFVMEYGIRKLLPLSPSFVPESFDVFMSKVKSNVATILKGYFRHRLLRLEEIRELIHLGFPLDITKITTPFIYTDLVRMRSEGYDYSREEIERIDNNIEKLFQKEQRYEKRFEKCNSELEKESLRCEVEADLLEMCISMLRIIIH